MHIDERIQYYIKGANKQNFGDYLPVLFVEKAFASARVEADIYFLIGSCIESNWIRSEMHLVRGAAPACAAYWCCGMRNATPLDEDVMSMCSFFGVRGKLTRDALGLPASTALGDPGLLVPLMHDCNIHEATQGKTICVPHFQDVRTDEEIEVVSGADIVVRPVVDGNIEALETVIDKIASADFVLAGSLHAGIIACAYNVPFAFWKNGHADISFKYSDFSSSINVPFRFCATADEAKSYYEREVRHVIEKPKLSRILDVCPYNVRLPIKLKGMLYDGLIDIHSYESLLGSIDGLVSDTDEVIESANVSAMKWRRSRMGLFDNIYARLTRSVYKSVRAIRANCKSSSMVA